jgi:hypothetical protein
MKLDKFVVVYYIFRLEKIKDWFRCCAWILQIRNLKRQPYSAWISRLRNRQQSLWVQYSTKKEGKQKTGFQVKLRVTQWFMNDCGKCTLVKFFCDSDLDVIVKKGSSYIFSIESNFENVFGHHKVVYITLFKMPLV